MRCCLLQGLGLRVEVVGFRVLVRELRRLDSASCVSYCVYYCCQCCRFPAAVTRLQGSCQEMVCGGWCVYRLCQRQVTKQTCADRQMVDLCACLLECDKSYTRTPCTLRPLYVARVRLATIVTEVSIAFILRNLQTFGAETRQKTFETFTHLGRRYRRS